MLRQFGRGLHAAWVVIDALLVAGVCVFLASQPELQRSSLANHTGRFSISLLSTVVVLGWPASFRR